MATISNPDKLLFTNPDFSKADVAAYFGSVADRMLPHLADRPLTIERYPNGIGAKGFFQKRVSGTPPQGMGSVRLMTSKGPMDQPVVESVEALLYLVNLAAITFHVPTATAEEITDGGEAGRPDRLVFDLDPVAGDLDGVRRAARFVRDFLDEAGLVGHLLATGSKGFHVVVPIELGPTYEEVGRFMQGASEMAARREPATLTTEFLIKDRAGRVYLDWLRNRSAHATTVAPYSLRPRPGAPVATPILWDELLDASPDGWKLDSGLADRRDPWRDFEAARRPLPPAAELVARDLEAAGIDLVPFDRFGRRPQR